MIQIWPAILVAGGTYAGVQLLIASLHGPWLAAVIASLTSAGALIALLRVWQPAELYDPDRSSETARIPARESFGPSTTIQAWAPWAILTVTVFAWSLPAVTAALNSVSAPVFEIVGLHNQVQRVPPVVNAIRLEGALFSLNWLSAAGSGALLAAILTAVALKYSPVEALRVYWKTVKKSFLSLFTIATTMSIGFVMRYAGLDGVLGVMIAQTGPFYPFFGTLLGWLGVAVTGSDTSSNVLFGSLQRLTAEKLGLSATLMAAANSAGGVMGKMIGAQSIVVATTATNSVGREGEILRKVFLPSVALAILVALWVTAIAYILPQLAI
jgi:lactate permease